MRRAALVSAIAGVAFLCASGVGAAPPPPNFPSGQPLGPPITLKFPNPGQVLFFSVSVTATLKPGDQVEKLTPIAYGHPDPNERLAGGMTKPVTTGDTTTFKFYFAIKNISTKRKTAAVGGEPPPQVDIFGNPLLFAAIEMGVPVPVSCADIKAAYHTLQFLYAVLGFGDKALEMWSGALSSCP
ncbi:MAG: hypothetical protein JOY72_01775 [Actinobacteria bacterium]|nr:hypothetical protein [Actinomycetota bacterium]